MVERVSAFITIGGRLSPDHLPEFLDLIAQEDLSLEWDGEPFEISQLVAGKSLCLMNHEVALGQFSRLEDFCFARGLPFRRWCDGSRSWMPQRALFNGEGDISYIATDGADRVLLDRETMNSLGSFDGIVVWYDAADFVIPAFEIIELIGADKSIPGPERELPAMSVACCLVKVRASVADDALEIEDRSVPGLYAIALDQADIDRRADDDEPIIEAAKDIFHDCIAIGNLDDFEIDVEVVSCLASVPEGAQWLARDMSLMRGISQ
ncbi:hypothetical protein [Novosphingobium terrae]|uniref:hypothetical protein n=1 Tax=Novosphingobium terrae TaxID=2726189 RepID=UPI001980CFBE|nr:hypothetical protein [Novosphingobium terrae]